VRMCTRRRCRQKKKAPQRLRSPHPSDQYRLTLLSALSGGACDGDSACARCAAAFDGTPSYSSSFFFCSIIHPLDLFTPFLSIPRQALYAQVATAGVLGASPK
jgi:hypothetical protein